jgi:two-component sensor histidine kinase
MDRAVSLGLIINELVSNSFKHAFQGCEKGEITISCRGSEDQVQLSIKDSGMGIPDDVDMDNPSSLGLQLVTILVKQLKGTIKYERDNGAKFTIMFSAKPESIREVKEYAR